jgi:hypothetical protein
LCLGIIIHHLSFLKKMDDKKKKEAESGFAALTSILPVETQWGALGDLAENVESVGAHSRIGEAG